MLRPTRAMGHVLRTLRPERRDRQHEWRVPWVPKRRGQRKKATPTPVAELVGAVSCCHRLLVQPSVKVHMGGN